MFFYYSGLRRSCITEVKAEVSGHVRDVQRITKILHNGSKSGSEWARDLATYVYVYVYMRRT